MASRDLYAIKILIPNLNFFMILCSWVQAWMQQTNCSLSTHAYVQNNLQYRLRIETCVTYALHHRMTLHFVITAGCTGDTSPIQCSHGPWRLGAAASVSPWTLPRRIRQRYQQRSRHSLWSR